MINVKQYNSENKTVTSDTFNYIPVSQQHSKISISRYEGGWRGGNGGEEMEGEGDV